MTSFKKLLKLLYFPAVCVSLLFQSYYIFSNAEKYASHVFNNTYMFIFDLSKAPHATRKVHPSVCALSLKLNDKLKMS